MQSEKGGVNVCEFVQKMKNEGRLEGVLVGRREGVALGEQRGISSMQAALSALYAQGREADVKRALTDSAYLAELLVAYQN